MQRIILAIVLAALLSACGGNPPPPRAQQITAEEFGDAWPFQVEEGLLRCEQGRVVVFITDDATYAVNTAAQSGRDQKGESILPILRSRPDDPTQLVPLAPITELGEQLCEQARAAR